MSAEDRQTSLEIQAGACSVVGKVRDHNEDSALVDSDVGVFAVADGLGGHQAGERASSLAVQILKEHLRATRANGSDPSLEGLLEAFDVANAEILADAVEHPERSGMGTTLTAAVVEGSRLMIGHVGDSRAWRIRDGVVTQLTRDHTVVAQQVRDGVIDESDAASHPMRHILSRCLGVREELEVDLLEMDIDVGDVYVLASDGLDPGIGPDDLREVVADNDEAEIAARVMVNRACERDGHDNITAVVISCREA